MSQSKKVELKAEMKPPLNKNPVKANKGKNDDKTATEQEREDEAFLDSILEDLGTSDESEEEPVPINSSPKGQAQAKKTGNNLKKKTKGKRGRPSGK